MVQVQIGSITYEISTSVTTVTNSHGSFYVIGKYTQGNAEIQGIIKFPSCSCESTETFISKFDHEGKYLYSVILSSDDSYIYSLACDSDYNMYIGGFQKSGFVRVKNQDGIILGEFNEIDKTFISSFDVDGNYMYSRIIDNTDSPDKIVNLTSNENINYSFTPDVFFYL